MFSNQSKVPPLPIPDLQDTVAKFVDWTSPLVDDAGRAEAKRCAEDFLAGAGPKLHQALLAHSQGKDNWLHTWWENAAYLQYRLPVPIHSNYSYGWGGMPLGDTWTMYAARMVTLMNEFDSMIRTESLEPQFEKDAPLCMKNYKALFGTNRIPRPGTDELKYSSGAPHIILMFRGNLYKMDIEGASADQIYTTFEHFVRNPGPPGDCTGIGILTCMHRDEWATLYADLEKDPKNKQFLADIDTAKYVLSLDDCTINTLEEHIHQSMSAINLPQPFNRYYDKNFNMAIAPSGHCIFNGEHGWGDGFTTISMMLWVLDKVASTPTPKLLKNETTPCNIQPLTFNVSPAVKQGMAKAFNDFKDLSDNTPACLVDVWNFGTTDIKKLGVSPDAFVQVSMMISAHLVTNTFPNAYESVMTRKFSRGRTEAGRQMTAEAAEAGRVWRDPSSTTEQKAAAFRSAAKAHVHRISQCKNATGVDRHLLGLKMIYAEQGDKLGISEKPALFSCEAAQKLGASILSTSTLGGGALRFFGFGPVDEDGFGLAYMMQPSSLHVLPSARKHNPGYPAIAGTIKQVLNEAHTALAKHK